MKKSYDEVVREAEAVKHTAAELEGLVPVKARVAKPVRSVYSVRMSSEELGEISKAASRLNMTTSDFIRQAALSASRGELELEPGRQEAALLTVREKARELYRAVEEL